MPSICKECGRPKGPPHHSAFGVCDMVTLSDGRHVHASRLEIGGDLREKLGDDLKIVNRWWKQQKKTRARRS